MRLDTKTCAIFWVFLRLWRILFRCLGSTQKRTRFFIWFGFCTNWSKICGHLFYEVKQQFQMTWFLTRDAKMLHTYQAGLEEGFGILNFNDSYTLQCAKFMYDINTGTQMDFLCQLFQKTTSRHSYETRQAAKKKFAVPQARTNLKKRFITFNGVKIWNEIPLDIRSKSVKRLFQKHLRNWLLQKYL